MNMSSETDHDRRSHLREVAGTRQHKGEEHRRWFSCARADLYIWQNDDHSIRSFELCYAKPGNEHALRWRKSFGFDHSRVDDGEPSPLKNATPIVIPDGRFDADALALEFEEIAATIDPFVYRFVLGKLHRIG